MDGDMGDEQTHHSANSTGSSGNAGGAIATRRTGGRVRGIAGDGCLCENNANDTTLAYLD